MTMGLHVQRQADNVVRFSVRRRASAWNRLRQAVSMLSVYLLICGILGAADVEAHDSDRLSAMVLTLRRSLPGASSSSWFNTLRTRDQRLWYVVLGCALGGVYTCWGAGPRVESLLAMRSVGLQTEGGGATRFIPLDRIVDMVIHEGFVGFEVRHFLAVMLRDDTRLEVVFPRSLPRRKVLERVWRQAREVLFDEDDHRQKTTHSST